MSHDDSKQLALEMAIRNNISGSAAAAFIVSEAKIYENYLKGGKAKAAPKKATRSR